MCSPAQIHYCSIRRDELFGNAIALHCRIHRDRYSREWVECYATVCVRVCALVYFVSGKFSYLNASLNRTEILPTVTVYVNIFCFCFFSNFFNVCSVQCWCAPLCSFFLFSAFPKSAFLTPCENFESL